MTSQRVERTWIRTGGYGRFRGEWVKEVWIIWISPLDYPLTVCSGHSDLMECGMSQRAGKKVGRKMEKEDALATYFTFYPSLFFLLASLYTILTI